MLEQSTGKEIVLRVAQKVACTEAEGPGKRFALWLQGCPLRCVECCNPEMLKFDGGAAVPLRALVAEIAAAKEKHDLEGITFIGGEPTAHAEVLVPLAAEVQALGMSVMMFSGFTLAQLKTQANPSVLQLLERTDILVDGPYLKDQPETRRRWIGSANQEVHFLSTRYQSDDPRWLRPNTLEIRMEGNQIFINGYPAKHAKEVWKRLGKKAQAGRSSND